MVKCGLCGKRILKKKHHYTDDIAFDGYMCKKCHKSIQIIKMEGMR